MNHQSDSQLIECQDALRDRVPRQVATQELECVRRQLDAKAFKCRFKGYAESVKGYRILDMKSNEIRIVMTVKFMGTLSWIVP